MRTAAALILVVLLAGCARPASDKAWTMKNLWEAVDGEERSK